jgi:single-stranded DNA-binding protein
MNAPISDSNVVILTGVLETAPAVRELPSGLPVANVRLASQSRFLSTNKVRAMNSIPLIFYGPDAESAARFRANEPVFIQGEIVTRSTSPTGNRHTTEIVVRLMRRLDDGEQGSVSDTTNPETWG